MKKKPNIKIFLHGDLEGWRYIGQKNPPNWAEWAVCASCRVRPKHIRYRLSADNIGIGQNFGFAETENPVSVSVSADNLFQYR